MPRTGPPHSHPDPERLLRRRRGPPRKRGPPRREADQARREGRPLSLGQELLEIAFHRASTVSVGGKTPLARARHLALRKIGRTSGILLRHLRKRTQPFRVLSDLSPFTRSLLKERLGEGTLERSLSRLRVAQERMISFRTEEERRIPGLTERDAMADAVRRFYGRAASLIREVEPDLLRLDEAARLLKDRPALEGSLPAVVVTGFPNVGKSSLVGRLSSARPRVGPYPFTTVAVSLGHMTLGTEPKLQVVDTPGLLHDAGDTRHSAEREALLAMEAGQGLVLFLLDPTGSCGWPLSRQEELLGRLRARFPDRRFLEVENKADLLRSPSSRLKISCLTGEGLEDLLRTMEDAFREMHPGLPDLPPIREGVDEPGEDAPRRGIRG